MSLNDFNLLKSLTSKFYYLSDTKIYKLNKLKNSIKWVEKDFDSFCS